MEYLYTDGEFWHFMKTDGTYEQFAAGAGAVGETVPWLTEQGVYGVTLWNGDPISVTPPNFVELEVTETDPGLKGEYRPGRHQARPRLSTGASIKVPLFVNQGDILRIDTRTGEYVSRGKH